MFYGCIPTTTLIHKSQLSPGALKVKILTPFSLACDKLPNLVMHEILTCIRFHASSPLGAESLVSGPAKLFGLHTVEKNRN